VPAGIEGYSAIAGGAQRFARTFPGVSGLTASVLE
jgi:hypothetical protein